MSTVVVVRKNNIAVIGADSLTKFGSVKHKSHLLKNNSKIVKLGDTIIAYVGPSVYESIFNNYFKKLKVKHNLIPGKKSLNL